jgi:hypothetical protein
MNDESLGNLYRAFGGRDEFRRIAKIAIYGFLGEKLAQYYLLPFSAVFSEQGQLLSKGGALLYLLTSIYSLLWGVFTWQEVSKSKWGIGIRIVASVPILAAVFYFFLLLVLLLTSHHS